MQNISLEYEQDIIRELLGEYYLPKIILDSKTILDIFKKILSTKNENVPNTVFSFEKASDYLLAASTARFTYLLVDFFEMLKCEEKIKFHKVTYYSYLRNIYEPLIKLDFLLEYKKSSERKSKFAAAYEDDFRFSANYHYATMEEKLVNDLIDQFENTENKRLADLDSKLNKKLIDVKDCFIKKIKGYEPTPQEFDQKKSYFLTS